MADDPDIAHAITQRRERLEGAGRERQAQQDAREAKIAAFRRQAEATILPELQAVVDQVTTEAGIKAEVLDELENASPWIALKMRVPPRTSEVRFTYDLAEDSVTVRTTGEGEDGPQQVQRVLADLTTGFVHELARDAFVHAAT